MGAAQSAKLRASVDPQSAQRALHRAPSFIENKGQWDSRARFLARTRGADVWVTQDGYVIDYYRKTSSGKKNSYAAHAVKMTFEGAEGAKVGGLDPTNTRTDFFMPGKTAVQGARSYSSVYGKRLYPGVDVRSYISDGNARWDLIVSPKTNPRNLAFRLDGVKDLRIDGRDLIYRTSLGDRRQGGLFAYQLVDGKKKPVTVAFERRGENRVGFRLGAYDRTKQLVIDPVLFGSYFGGDRGDDEIHAVTSDKDGAVYMTGVTRSPVFPAISGDRGLQGAQDFFLTRFQGDAYNIDYNAYVGGTGEDWGDYIQLSPNKTALWITGYSNSPALPGDNGGNVDPDGRPYPYFLMRFPLDPVTVVKAPTTRYFGKYSVNFQRPYTLEDFAVTPILGNVVIAGMATQTVPGFGKAHPQPGKPYAYVAVYSPTLSARYITYVGGTNAAANIQFGARQGLAGPGGGLGVQDIAISSQVAETHIALTGSVGVDQVNFLPISDGDDSVIPVKAGPSGSYSGYNLLRGTGAVEQPTQTPVMSDAFVAKFTFREQIATSGRVPDPSGLQNVFTGLLGGSLNEYGADVAVGNDGSVYMVGATTSFDYPRTRGVYGGDDRTNQLVVTKLAADGSAILYSTHLRTTASTVIPYDRADLQPRGIAVDSRGVVAVSGLAYQYGGAPAMGTQEPLTATYTAGDQGVRTSDGFIQMLDSTASTLVFGTFIGTANNDVVYTPHSAPGNDFWIFGWTDSYFRNLANAAGTFGALPEIGNDGDATPWKPRPDQPNLPQDAAWDQLETLDNGLPGSPVPVATRHRRDGFIYRVRVLAPAIASVTTVSMNTGLSTIPGGFNAKGRVQVTLDAAAPAGGASVVVTIPDDAPARFANGNKTTVIFIPEGQTQNPVTATATENLTTEIITEQVSSVKRIDLRASYDGAFKVGPFNVVPWLQRVVALPDNIAGGNLLGVRVILAEPLFEQPATPDPNRTQTSPITVDLAPANTSDPIEAGRITITAPAQEGQTYLRTKGVSSNIDVTLSAQTVEAGALVGAKLQPQITVRPASLTGVRVTPTQTTDFIGLQDGVAKPKVEFTLIFDGATPAGGALFNLKTSNSSVTIEGTKNSAGQYVVNIPAATTIGQAFTKSFNVKVGTFAAITDVVLTATKVGDAAQSKSASLRIIPVPLGEITLNTNVTKLSATSYSIYDGFSTTGTIKLGLNAPASGARVYIKAVDASGNDDPSVTVVDKSVYFDPGTGVDGKPFRLKTSQLLTDKTVQLRFSRNPNFTSGVKTLSLTIKPHQVASVVLSTPEVYGGFSVTGKAMLDANAPAGGMQLYISSNNSSVTPQTSVVTVKAGARSVAFKLNTTPVLSSQNVTVTVSRSASGSAPQATANLLVKAHQISSFTLSPTSVYGGFGSTGRVVLDGPAPEGGIEVFVTSTNEVATVPVNVVVPAGARAVTFNVRTSTVLANTTASIKVSRASDGGAPSATATLTVLAHAFRSIELTPNPAMSGDTVKAVVRINGAAPAGGLRVYVSSSQPTVANPEVDSVVIPEGQYYVAFNVKAGVVIRESYASIRASRTADASAGSKVAQTLTVRPQRLTTIRLTPEVARGGELVRGLVTLSAAAPEDITVYLASSNSDVARVKQSSVTILKGSTSAYFSVQTSAVLRDTDVTISAARDSAMTIGKISARLSVIGLRIQSIDVNPNPIPGGTSATVTVTLDGNVPAGQFATLNISTDRNDLLNVPATATQKAGDARNQITFQIGSVEVARDLGATLVVSLNGNDLTKNVTISRR